MVQLRVSNLRLTGFRGSGGDFRCGAEPLRLGVYRASKLGV